MKKPFSSNNITHLLGFRKQGGGFRIQRVTNEAHPLPDLPLEGGRNKTISLPFRGREKVGVGLTAV